jgi:hypothetical protein
LSSCSNTGANLAVIVTLQEWVVMTSARRLARQHYSVEEKIHVQIIRTVIFEMADINAGNNQV